MGKNNPLRGGIPENRNYRLYKAKKQWITACATFMLAFGATAVINASADTTSPVTQQPIVESGSSTPSNQPTANSSSAALESATGVEKENPLPGVKPVTTENSGVDSSPKVTNNSNVDNSMQDQSLTLPSQADSPANTNTFRENKIAQNITPNPWTSDDGTTVVWGTNLQDKAADLLQNGAALEASGAKIAWVGSAPVVTQAMANNEDTVTGTVKVTYANGQSVEVPVSFVAGARAALNPDKFYYVENVNEQVNINTPDSNGTVLYNADNSGIISAFNTLGTNVTVAGPSTIDTSTVGIHWTDVTVVDNNTFNGINKVIADPYSVSIPYIVKGLKIRDDIPKDAAGNPVINAQLATQPLSPIGVTPNQPQVAFDPTATYTGSGQKNNGTWGDYFYQDYPLAFALGIKVTASDWTDPTDLQNTKTNHFKMSLTGLTNADTQEVTVNYVAAPKPETLYYYNYQNKPLYSQGFSHNPGIVNDSVDNGDINSNFKIELPDGTIVKSTKVTASLANGKAIDQALPNYVVDGRNSGKFRAEINIEYSGTNKFGQPQIWTKGTLATASANFNSEVNKWYQKTNNGSVAAYSTSAPAVWINNWEDVNFLLSSQKTSNLDNLVADVTNGAKTYTSQDLSNLVENSTKPLAVKLPDGKWPEGTKFEWISQDGSASQLVFDQAGETKTGSVKIILPTGSSYTVNDITVVSKANVLAKSETIDYGTKLSANDLVTNANVFPSDATFNFVNNTEPDWQKSGSYTNVQITATYKGPDGQEITTPAANCAVAINDSREITVLQGSSVPDINSILDFAPNWEQHTVSWTNEINTNSTNQGLITVHYPSSNLDQEIKVYVNVIPKQTAVNNQEFKTDGSRYDGQAGSIANGENQGAILTSADGQPVTYDNYAKSGDPGQQNTYTKESTSYSPTYSLSGLQTDSNGKLVSGNQNATVRVTVPKGTLGASVDSNGNYYYDVPVSVVIAQPVTFEFVDTYNNNQVVGQTYSQEFLPGVSTKLDFTMQMPAGETGVWNYVLSSGQSIPTSYTLDSFSNTPKVVQVGIHESMHFTINVHDDTDNTTIGSAVVPTANAGNGGSYNIPNTAFNFPKDVTAGDYQSVSVSGVPEGATFTGSFWVPFNQKGCQWYTPSYKWDNTEAVEKALTGATITIHVVHRTQTTTQTQTRTATVNYVKAKVNEDGTYTEDGSATTSSVLQVFYSRDQIQDLVTKKSTYTPWLWDTSKNNGYQVDSGNWTVPTSWGPVVADVPTIDGYTAAIITDKSNLPANQFVYPTWNNTGADGKTDPAQASLAYTTDTTAYAAQPVHTVLYIPVEQQARTVTAHMKYADAGDLTGQNAFPDEQINLIYQRTGTLDPQINKITYGSWNWDTSAGNENTPGFEIVSGDNWGNLGSKGHPQTGSWSFNAPNKNGYTTVTHAVDGNYNTQWKGKPTSNGFENATNTDYYWAYRNDFTVYYVPDSQLKKTVTRTIEITEPGKTTQTVTQTVTLNRTVNLNTTDTGVVYGNWSTGSWNAQSVPTHPGYTMSATQTVNGVTTPITIINGQIPAQTVDGTTQDTTINISWGAVATAELTGNGESTYNGQAITNSELNNSLKVTVTGPTAGSGSYTLQNGDVEFSTDGTNWTTNMPINAGQYQVRLTSQGEEGIEKQFGNNSIVWTNNGQSTITSNASYTINKLASDAVMANAQTGNYEMTYNGAAPSSIDPSKFTFTAKVNGQSVTLKSNDLTSADFSWVDSSAPVNVGTYQVKLNAQGLAKLQADNPNFTLTNAGSGTFTINQANASATLSGSASRPYNGQAVTVSDLNASGDGNNITLTLHYPKDGNADYSTTVKLNAGDFTWNTPNGQAPVNASSQAYTITINPAAVQKIIEQAAGSGQNGVSNVKFAQDAISGTASYTITPLNTDAVLTNTETGNYTNVYDAQPTNQIDPAKFQITANVNGQTITLNTDSLTGNSYEWVDDQGNPLTANPENVGTYYVKLTQSAFETLQAQNPNFKLTNTGLGIYTITPAQATGSLSGSNSKVYDGTPVSVDQLNSNGNIKVSLNFPGANDRTYTLKQGDYTISGNATDGGTYTVTLTNTGITNVENYIKSLACSGQNNQSNVQFAANAISGQASFEITPSANVISVGGVQTETYNGSPINVVYNASGDNSVVVSIAKASGNTTGALASLSDVALDSSDFTVVNGSATNAGTYEVKLTDAGLTKIQTALGKNYSISLAGTVGNLIIKKAKASAEFSGDAQYTYTGTSEKPADYLGQYSIKLDEPNNPTYKLVAGDIEFNVNGAWTTEAPVNVGQYQVRLSQQGWNNIKAINSANVEWSATASAGTGTYTIKQANVTAELSGQNSMTYNGSAVTTADLYTPGSTITVAINGTGIANLPKTFTLSDGDYEWTNGSAPVNVGNYTIKLTTQGINKIQDQINQAVGEGNVALTTSADNAGSASFEIKQAVASNVQLYGNEQSTYNGQAVSFDPTNSETAKNFGFHNVENLTVPTLSASDFSWYDADGNEISAPTNAGTYYLRLNKQGEEAWANANSNYTFEDNGKSTISGQITYTVNPAQLVIEVAGSASMVFNNHPAVITQEQINNGDIKLVWGNSNSQPSDLGKFTLTPEDLEVVDANGKPAIHANAGLGTDGQPIKGKPYIVRLTASGLEKIKQLSGASNYTISQSDKSGQYFIYEHKAELTLTGNQTTVYGTPLPFDPSAYHLDFTNWLATDRPVPHLTWKDGKLYNNNVDTGITWAAGDLYVDGYPNGGVPTDVGTYRVKISKQLTDKLRELFPDYDFSGNIGKDGTNDNNNLSANGNSEPVEVTHTPASYVITPAETTVTINGAQHVKYGESTAIENGQYTVSVTAPVSGVEKPVVTNVALTAADLTTVAGNSNVGTYQIKLTDAGLAKIQQAITGHGDVTKNYNWTQAKSAYANFYVDQMPVTITVSGDKSVTYGSTQWQQIIGKNPSGYTLTIAAQNGANLNYQLADGDLVFNQTPGNVGTYQVELSAQGLANIEKALGTNYSYPQTAANVTAKGTLTINQGEVTVTLNGNESKTYDAKQTLSADLDLSKYNITYSVPAYSANGTAQTLTLTHDDLQIVGNATNTGTYTVELSQTGQDKLKDLTGNNGANYKWTFYSKADYQITAAKATAELSGSNEKVFDGSAVTTAQVNSNGQILVHFTFPGSNAQSTYTLQDGDYTWANGSAPTNVGTYEINLNKDAILQHLQTALNTQAGTGNVTINADGLSGTATFKITPKEITNVTISGDDQSKIYDGRGADLNTSSLTISADGTIANKPLVDTSITASDFDWYDGDTELNSVPTDAGTYQARLKASVLQALQTANPDYSFNAVNGVINYTITPTKATITIGGSGTRDYNDETTSIADVVNSVTWSTTGLVSGQTLNTAGITANSYAWYTKDNNGNYQTMTGNPVNVGTYYLRLTSNAISQIQKDNPNYSFTDNAIGGEFTYTINAAKAAATLSGQASKTYDGKAVTTAEVNSTAGNIIVNFTYPGSTAQSTYTLQDDDYTWETEDNQSPVNAGTYALKLSDQGLAHLQAALNKFAGSGNLTLAANDLSGSAKFTINQKELNVTLDNQTGTIPGKTYDGQAASIDSSDANFTANGLIAGQSLNTNGLAAKDFEWVDANGDPISAPTAAGTYYIALNKSGLAKLQSNNPNYAISESGQFKYVISPAQAKVAITGSQKSTEAKIDGANFKVNVPAGITIPEGIAYEFASGTTPDQSGVYLISLTPESIEKLEDANPNYKLNISSTAEFTLDATLTITFQDTDEGNKTVGNPITKTAVAGTQMNLGLTIPENYELAPNQEPLNVLNSYTFNKNLNQSLNIKLVHKTETVDPTNSNTNPDPSNPNWFKDNNLTKDITRTIEYKGLSQDQLNEIPNDQKKQIAQFNRTAKYDLVTKELVADSESAWIPASGKMAGFTPMKFAGYTADKNVPALVINGDSQNSTIIITYTADPQSVVIKFVDDDQNDKQVGNDIIKNGVTGQTIDNLDLSVPEHYELAKDQTLPTSYEFTAENNQTITIHLVEKTVTVDPAKPNTNPDPANQDWFKDNDLSKTVNRVIIDNLSSGAKTTTQSATITRTATYNEVTRKLTNYGNWTTAAWDAYQVNTPAGYTAKIVQISDGQDQVIQSIPSVSVVASTQPVRISITYTANAQTGKISYVDSDGQEIGQTTINGKTGEPVKVTPQVPAGWKIVPGQDIPTVVTATANGIPVVTVKVEHSTITVTPDTPEKDIPSGKVPGDPSKNYEKMESLTAKPTRMIVVTSPSGEKTTIIQAVSFTRTATFDDVTGEISYSDWTSAQPAEWSAYTAPEVAGYTASQAVTAQSVTPTTNNETVNISYAANTQTGKIIYRDSTGKEIGQTSLTAKTGETIKITPVAPTNWQIAPGQDIPTVVTATANGIPAVVITVEPQTETVQEHKTVTRTIIEHLPSGDKTVVQTVKLTGTGTKNLVNGKVTALKWTTGQFAAFTPETVPGYTTNMSIVPVENVTFESADSTVEITYSKIPTPTDSQQVIQYQDENGTIISTKTIKGQAGTEVTFNPQIPTNWQAVNAVPSTIKIAGGTTVILIQPQVEAVQKHKTVTRTIIEYLPSGNKKVVQTVELTGDGTKNLVTGEVSNLKWNSGKFAAFTPETVAGYTASPAVIAVEPVTVDTNNQTVDVAYTANEQTGKIIYRDQNGNEIGQTILTGHTGETIAVTPDLPAGWQPVTGQDVPATTVVTANGISTINITVEHKTIIVVPGQEAPTGQVPGNPDTTYEHMDALTDEVTRTIKVEKPDGQQQIVTQTVEFTRTAIFDEVTGQVTYSAWQPTGDTSWPAYKVPSVVGYTADRQDIPAETVAPGMSDQSITITYTKDAQPVQPVEPTTPTQPEKPNQPNKPVTPPHKPSMPAQPAVPTPGENLISGNNHEKAVEPDQVVNDHIANRHSISTQLQQSSQMNKQQVKKLPQTGNATNKAAVTLGFAFATLASIFGLAGMRRKRRTK
ncbi:KxYKxGKxW signal peptide domain-containing protein [Limosilactobacillus sp. RRLNB_1_1]|uniref:KxYKxGKxW signal peptide domain-containing protein n=1 Tax=Limosilactobacillus albertensis TaxID=2759752 RepID=A0A7W3TRN7_9LACO|nr:MBG domain-containing protein [Limosilactobacillus albertensis]MBB1069396.1 KxYKxGKxW signal peptide domain-containing protein [Limosilactobacillus albertensis]MCD7118572.1 KxYKxGKxW signal peptide domain-containing protein [Limosilactobacillus albertensis]MCD7128383.1 KxYKxGKxW signal peptide domain-containing protein [Limosilactobacillus albertensis]